MKKFWTYLKSLGRRLFQLAIRYPLATAATVFVVIGAVLLMIFGKREIQIGGILGKLWGKKPIESRVIPPEERTNPDGTPILPGQSDKEGFVQALPTTTIKKPGLFSDPKIVIIESGGKEVKIPLPTGVKNKDVAEVTIIKPDVVEVKSLDKGVSTTQLVELKNLLK
jgi:hypothetical protein